MQNVQGDGNPKTGHQLDHSEDFQLFLHCLGLPNQIPAKHWVWDAAPFFGIRRQRVFLRSHLDTGVPPSGITPGDEAWGPLIYLTNETATLAPLLRTRDYTAGGALKLSWAGYQPNALLWDYTFFGGKRSFALLCQLSREKIPQLPWASIVPAHFLPVWKKFLAVLGAAKSTSSTKDELIEQLAPIFHNPNVTLPMRILKVQEVRKLFGLEAILTVERHGPALLTDKVVRDFCGNSFHPVLIDAALGTDLQLQLRVNGSNDGQPCHAEAPPIHDVYAKYQDLLRLVLEQGTKRGVQLKSDQVDFEAKCFELYLLLLRTLKKIFTRCIKLAYVQERIALSALPQQNTRSVLPRILQVDAPWWNLAINQVAKLFQQEPEDYHQLLALDTRTIDATVMEAIGQSILQYRHTIRQDLPFRLKRLHVWNVSGWTPTQTGNDPKLRLIKRLLRTGPVTLQETRWHTETPETLYHNTGEDRLWESKFYIPFQPQKWASNKSNSSVTSSCASCGFLRSRLESQSWNSFNSFPIVNGVPAGVPTPPDSGKTPQLKTSKLAQNCGKTEVLHLQPPYGICWSHENRNSSPNVNKGFIRF